ncbi:MAG TPA: DnaD domain protein [Anaerolineales bacterium]
MFKDTEPASELPDLFFRRLLHEITDVEELKVTVYALWRIGHMDGPFRALTETEFDPRELGLTAEQIRSGLQAAIGRGSLVSSTHEGHAAYFINSPEGRLAAQSFGREGWPAGAGISSAPLERPNIFRLYEENIGPLTPLIADALNDAESNYPPEWVAEAIELAVKHNKRSWKYSEAILRRWKEEGRAEKPSGRDDQASRQHDVEDKIKKFVGGAG